jgi:polar amino acid transport system substrate-binding protein
MIRKAQIPNGHSSLILRTFGILVILLLTTSFAFAQETRIRFTTLKWEPYYGPSLMNGGYFTDIVREAFKRVGYPISVKYVPWKRALYEGKQLYTDSLLGIYYSEERTEWLYYSEPVSEAENCFFAKKGRNITWNTLEDLKQYRIGIEQGYSYSEEFDEAKFLQKEPVRKIELNVKKLLEGRVDLVLASKKRFLYWLNNNNPQARELIEVVPHPLSSNRLYIAFPKKAAKSEEYLKAFNEGLQMIKADGTYANILLRHGF